MTTTEKQPTPTKLQLRPRQFTLRSLLWMTAGCAVILALHPRGTAPFGYPGGLPLYLHLLYVAWVGAVLAYFGYAVVTRWEWQHVSQEQIKFVDQAFTFGLVGGFVPLVGLVVFVSEFRFSAAGNPSPLSVWVMLVCMNLVSVVLNSATSVYYKLRLQDGPVVMMLVCALISSLVASIALFLATVHLAARFYVHGF